MKRISVFRAKPFVICLLALLIVVSTIAGPAEAMLVPAAPQTQAAPLPDRAADLATIQKVLESKALQQRLVDYGLSPEEAMAKINGLSDGQIHQVAANIDALQAGGRIGTYELIIILLIVLLIAIII